MPIFVYMVETFQISVDSYYYLKDGAEPILDDDLEEAYAIEAMFPKGFVIVSHSPIGDTGYVEVIIRSKQSSGIARVTKQKSQTIVYEDSPEVAAEVSNYYDSHETFRPMQSARFELVWLDDTKTNARVFVHNLIARTRILFGDLPVHITPKGLQYVEKVNTNKTFTRLYLKDFVKVPQ